MKNCHKNHENTSSYKNIMEPSGKAFSQREPYENLKDWSGRV